MYKNSHFLFYLLFNFFNKSFKHKFIVVLISFVIIIIDFFFLINLSVRLYTSAATGSRVKKTGFFIFNGIKNKEKSIFYTKYNCWSLGKKNIYKPIKLGGTQWDFHFCKL